MLNTSHIDIHANEAVYSIVDTRDGGVACGCLSGAINIYYPKTPEVYVIEKTLGGDNVCVVDLVMTNDGRLTSACDLFVEIWNIYSGERECLILSSHLRHIKKLAVMADGRLVVSSVDDEKLTTLRFYNLSGVR